MDRNHFKLKQWQKWVAAMLLLGLGFAVWVLWPASEPAYHGKTLTVWLNEITPLSTQPRKTTETGATEALRQMGTNAIPRLLQLLQARDSSFKLVIRKFLAKQRWIKFRMDDAEECHSRAFRGLRALGPEAILAMPLLEERLFARPDEKPGRYGIRYGSNSYERQSAGMVLAEIGPPAFSIFEKALTNKDYEIRCAAIAGIGQSTNHLFSMAFLLAKSVQYEPETGLRTWVAIMLAKTGRYEELVVPVLLSGMKYPENDTRAESARALVNYPTQAQQHIEEIRALAKDRDIIARLGARDALRTLDPEAAERIK